MRLRVTPTDTLDAAQGTAGDSLTFSLVNNTPLSMEVVQPGDDAFDVAIRFRVSDPDPGETLTLERVGYSESQTGAGGDATAAATSPTAIGQGLDTGTFLYLWPG